MQVIFTYDFFSFFQQSLELFSSQVFTSLENLIPKVFHSFGCYYASTRVFHLILELFIANVRNLSYFCILT